MSERIHGDRETDRKQDDRKEPDRHDKDDNKRDTPKDDKAHKALISSLFSPLSDGKPRKESVKQLFTKLGDGEEKNRIQEKQHQTNMKKIFTPIEPNPPKFEKNEERANNRKKESKSEPVKVEDKVSKFDENAIITSKEKETETETETKYETKSEKMAEFKEKELKACQNFAESKGGKCISTVYQNTSTPMEWECKFKHKWEARWGDIKRGHWCPNCNLYYGETMARQFFQNIFQLPFEKARPDWLDKKELDGYNEELKLAFEFQGEQHYEIIERFKMTGEDLNKNQNNDEFKQIRCEEHGVNLIQIPYWIKLKDMQDYIVDEYYKKTGIKMDVPKINYHEFETAGEIFYKDLQAIAKERGGKLVSKSYFGANVLLMWECEFGHQWEALPSTIKRGYWCGYCAKRHRLDIEEMQKIANERGGECISPEYINSSTPLLWQCKEGHIWPAYPNDVKNKETWCPYCEDLAPKTIEDMQEVARNRGGQCVSSEYFGMGSKLRWKCGDCNNEWDASPSNVIHNDSWCPECAKKIVSEKLMKYTIEDMRKLAQKFNDGKGRFISEEFKGTHDLHRWKCGKCDHEWNACPTDIMQGHWCPNCAGNIKKTIQDMSILAQKHDDGKGKCLSSDYQNAHVPLLWKCGKCDFEWMAKPNTIEQGNWCPKCAGNIKQTISDMQEFAQQYGGKCRSDENDLVNINSSLVWECKKGHFFTSSPKYMKRKLKDGYQWCPKCQNENE